MIDLELDDDDLLDLPGVRLEPTWTHLEPAASVEVARCQRFILDRAAKRVSDLDYEGTDPNMQFWTHFDIFDFWWTKYLRDKNQTALDVAFLAAVRCYAGFIHCKVRSPLFDTDLRAEVMDVQDISIRLLVKLPFDNGRVKSNLRYMANHRMVWFGRRGGHAMSTQEPFYIV